MSTSADCGSWVSSSSQAASTFASTFAGWADTDANWLLVLDDDVVLDVLVHYTVLAIAHPVAQLEFAVWTLLELGILGGGSSRWTCAIR